MVADSTHQMLRLIFKCGIYGRQSVWCESFLHPCSFTETFWGRSLCFVYVSWFPVPCFYYLETLRKKCLEFTAKWDLTIYCPDDCPVSPYFHIRFPSSFLYSFILTLMFFQTNMMLFFSNKYTIKVIIQTFSIYQVSWSHWISLYNRQT